MLDSIVDGGEPQLLGIGTTLEEINISEREAISGDRYQLRYGGEKTRLSSRNQRKHRFIRRVVQILV